MTRALLLVAGLLLASVFLSTPLKADVHTVGEYTVHYSLLNTSFLEAKVATQYGIRRSKNIALLNISVIKKSKEEFGSAVISNIFGSGKNLVGQLKELAFKEVKEDKAIYYLATFAISNGERLSFDIKVQPEKKGKLIPIKFKQQVFVQ